MQAALGISVLGVPLEFLPSNSTMSTPEPAWSLHPQLARDTAPVGDLSLARVLAMNDANYPWVILVPRRAGVVEVIDLDAAERGQLMAEIAQVSAALKSQTGCDKLNVAAIGNVVPQLHMHVVARRTSDAAWPKPVWGAVPAKPYGAGELDTFVAALRRALAID
jgi:diadenosine tetraphosphate (Ap4A) HIT family hydrolase